MVRSAIVWLALAAAATAGNKNCKEIGTHIKVEARNGVFALRVPQTEVEVTNFILKLTVQNGNYTDSILRDYKTVLQDYHLSGIYCEPDYGKTRGLQILTHGIGFDRSYWDHPWRNYQNSYVQAALDDGWSTLTWDRLGIGASAHAHPLTDLQLFTEIKALKQFTRYAKSADLAGGKYKDKKIVHVGHSFGAALTMGMTSESPELSDGIILTGFSQVPDFVSEFALGGNFVSAQDVPNLRPHYKHGYLAPKSSIGVHQNFFAPDTFEPELLKFVTERGQPAAMGELLTIGSLPKQSNFNGPVMIVTGDKDIPFCGGNCHNTKAINGSAADLLELSRNNFKAASVFNTTIIKHAGHGLNLQHGALVTYRTILDFIGDNVKA
ncbi:hypothetical protein CDD83_8353 [Cordyceps sp. RAO-2017]|nr:hypothetical protein CDD83_8353 [Cordyceps sp. RAO-2017]